MACTIQSAVNYGLRRKNDAYYYELPVDPNWGIPTVNGQVGCPVFLDTTTGYVRPFSSTNDVADVIASPIKGWVQDYVPAGRPRTVYVWPEGIADIMVVPAVAVTAGVTKFKPYLDGSAVSNYKFSQTAVTGDQILTAIAHGNCPCSQDYPDYCVQPGAVADNSPTAAITQTAVSKATVRFRF